MLLNPCLLPHPCRLLRLDKMHALNAGLWSRSANITVTGDHGAWGRVRGRGVQGSPSSGSCRGDCSWARPD